jgi:hypothetical protein
MSVLVRSIVYVKVLSPVAALKRFISRMNDIFLREPEMRIRDPKTIAQIHEFPTDPEERRAWIAMRTRGRILF